MKNIAVVCNNEKEWRLFVDTLQFTLSKDNLRYKTVSETIVDLTKQVKYIYINNHWSSIPKLRGREWYGVTNLAGYVDGDLNEALNSMIREENKMAKIIVMNGCPNSGKDTAAEYVDLKYNAQHLRFKDGLYKVAAMVAGITEFQMKQLATFRPTKETPSHYFSVGGEFVSPRQWLIHCSENIVKPLLGKDFFGKQLAQSITSDLVVCSDGGFESEIIPLLEAGHDVYVFRIEREGYTFAGDSRNYLPTSPLYKTFLVENNGTLEQFLNKVGSIVDDIVGISGTSGESK